MCIDVQQPFCQAATLSSKVRSASPVKVVKKTLKRLLTRAKVEFPELKTVNAQVLQQVLRKLETAFVDMTRKKMGFPRFKNRYRLRSFVYPQRWSDGDW